ncbi:MAG: hypothetical protein EOO09_18575 [Chitinophagaceae bacterium]|nr:MAG: hypothetical protein EOO09_18575 [Chitinophagaceae bacterium]
MLKTFLATVFISLSFISYSQRLHIGVFGGAAAYNGDLTSKIFPKKVTNAVIGGSLNYELTDNIMLRGQLSYAVVGGADRYSDKADLRARNLSFESRIYEGSLVGEYYLLDLYSHRFTPYLFAGLAMYHHNPYTYSPNGQQKIYLRPLKTEGQGLPGYAEREIESNLQWAIPVGGGIKYAVTDNLHIGLELGIRKLFTDYLDDVSGEYADPADLLNRVSPQAVAYSYRGDELPGGDPVSPGKGNFRGSPKYKDLYYFTGLHLTYRINLGGKTRERERRFGKDTRLGCPPSVN